MPKQRERCLFLFEWWRQDRVLIKIPHYSYKFVGEPTFTLINPKQLIPVPATKCKKQLFKRKGKEQEGRKYRKIK
jgi:hypothetical protein